MQLSPDWEFVADTVMGGVSTGTLRRETVAGRDAVRLTGSVTLDKGGGFIQMAADLGGKDETLDASAFSGLALDLRGNGAAYDLRLRTADLSRPWQSYRASFTAPQDWTTITFAFNDLAPHRTEAPFDASRLRRIGILAVGREMGADVALSGLRLVI